MLSLPQLEVAVQAADRPRELLLHDLVIDALLLHVRCVLAFHLRELRLQLCLDRPVLLQLCLANLLLLCFLRDQGSALDELAPSLFVDGLRRGDEIAHSSHPSLQLEVSVEVLLLQPLDSRVLLEGLGELGVEVLLLRLALVHVRAQLEVSHVDALENAVEVLQVLVQAILLGLHVRVSQPLRLESFLQLADLVLCLLQLARQVAVRGLQLDVPVVLLFRHLLHSLDGNRAVRLVRGHSGRRGRYLVVVDGSVDLVRALGHAGRHPVGVPVSPHQGGGELRRHGARFGPARGKRGRDRVGIETTACCVGLDSLDSFLAVTTLRGRLDRSIDRSVGLRWVSGAIAGDRSRRETPWSRVPKENQVARHRHRSLRALSLFPEHSPSFALPISRF